MVAPVLATRLYALSRALERGERADVSVVLRTWLIWQNSYVNKFSNAYWCMVQRGALLGLIPIIPMLGHASWHAYRELVDVSALPTRAGDGH